LKNRDHVHAADAITHNVKIPVLFTVPVTVMASAPKATPAWRNAPPLNAGFDVRSKFATSTSRK